MNSFYIAPADLRRLGRWLRCHVVAVIVLMMLLTVLRMEPGSVRSAVVQATQQSGIDAWTERSSLPSVAAARSVPPTGWRRTAAGWEHTATWSDSVRPLGQWIQVQQQREPRWMQTTLATVRQIPPVLFALMQIAAIWTVVVVSRNRDKVQSMPVA